MIASARVEFALVAAVLLHLVACVPPGPRDSAALPTLNGDADDSPNMARVAPVSPLHVLWVSSYGPEDPWSLKIRTGIWETLARAGYSVARDTLEWDAYALGYSLAASDADLVVRAEDVVAALDGLTPDVFIVSDDEAVRALLPHLPRSATGVVCGLNTSLERSLASDILEREHLAVVVEPLRPVQTVRMAREFTGGTGPYLLIGDASFTGQTVTEAAYATLEQLGIGGDVDRGVAGTWAAWKDLAIQEGRVAEFVLITAYQPLPDETGELVDGRTMMTWMLENLDVPVFSLVNSLVIDGAVGGLVADGYEQGRLAGELAMAVAEGFEVPSRTAPSKLVINAAAARYWGLDIPALFPVAAEVYGSLPSFAPQSHTLPASAGPAMARTKLNRGDLPQELNALQFGTMALSGGQP